MARATSTGRFSASPPSTSSCPRYSTGANTPSADMLARMRSGQITVDEDDAPQPVSRLVATARKRVGS